VVSIAPPFGISKELSLRFGSAGEAKVWARKLEHASKLWQSSMCISSRDFSSGSSEELTAAQETLSSLETIEGASSSPDGAPLSRNSDEHALESDDDSIDSWVEAQIERSSQLLAMFQQQEKWLGSTEDCVARQLQATSSRLCSRRKLCRLQPLRSSRTRCRSWRRNIGKRSNHCLIGRFSALQLKAAAGSFKTLRRRPLQSPDTRQAPLRWRLDRCRKQHAQLTHPEGVVAEDLHGAEQLNLRGIRLPPGA